MLPKFVVAIFVLSAILVENVKCSPGRLDDNCVTDHDCKYDHASCKPYASTICPQFGLYCQCARGFIPVNGECKPEVRLGDFCGPSFVCIGESVMCKWLDQYGASYCECEDGTEPEDVEVPTRCVKKFVALNRTHNRPCASNANCQRRQECVDKRCTCPRGHRYASGQDLCLPISYGAACTGDTDCQLNLANSVCSPLTAKCHCAGDYQPLLVTFKGATRVVCHKKYSVADYQIKDIGQPCNEDVGMGPVTYCTAPASCTACSPDGGNGYCLTTAMKSGNWTTIRQPLTTKTTTALTTTTTTTTRAPVEGKGVLKPLGSRCNTNNDCLVKDSRCTEYGRCQCVKNYVQRGAYQCRLPESNLALGRFCDPRFDKCGVRGSKCVENICQCEAGFKPGPENLDCIEKSRVGSRGDQCTSSLDCLYELVCLDSVCSCFTGYKEYGNYHCRKRVLSDACPSGEDSECRFITNAACERGTCLCSFGFTRLNSSYCDMIPRSEDLYKLQKLRARCEIDSDCWYPPAPAYSVCNATSQFCVCNRQQRYYSRPTNACVLYKDAPDDTSCIYDRDCNFDKRRTKCFRSRCVDPRLITSAAQPSANVNKLSGLLLLLTSSSFIALVTKSSLLSNNNNCY